jgi:hypothetical protein
MSTWKHPSMHACSVKSTVYGPRLENFLLKYERKKVRHGERRYGSGAALYVARALAQARTSRVFDANQILMGKTKE